MSAYRSRVGITVEQYDAMLAAQGGGCAICGSKPKTRRLDVDHDHKTGRLRGLLSHRCNRGLQYFNDDPARLVRAAVYLLGPTWQSAALEGIANDLERSEHAAHLAPPSRSS